MPASMQKGMLDFNCLPVSEKNAELLHVKCGVSMLKVNHVTVHDDPQGAHDQAGHQLLFLHTYHRPS